MHCSMVDPRDIGASSDVGRSGDRNGLVETVGATGQADALRPPRVMRGMVVRTGARTIICINQNRRWNVSALVFLFLAVLPEAGLAAADDAFLPRNLSPWGMFVNADIVVKAVMVGLAVASLVTWTVWLAKTNELRRKTARAKRRLKLLEGDTTLADVEHDSAGESDAVAQIIQSAAREASLSSGVFDDGFKERIALRLERVEAAMSRQIARGTGVLATIGATAPFVGLFGTVWGIMNAFIGISEARTTNLAVVAPGIAEALLATALGLIAAIPAVVIYNHLARSITAYRALLGDASAQVLLLISREGSRGARRIVRAAE
jgi:biopolymer transport protein ExbB